MKRDFHELQFSCYFQILSKNLVEQEPLNLKANFKRPLPPPSAATTLHTWREGGDGLFAQVLLKKEPYLTHSVESNEFSVI